MARPKCFTKQKQKCVEHVRKKLNIVSGWGLQMTIVGQKNAYRY